MAPQNFPLKFQQVAPIKPGSAHGSRHVRWLLGDIADAPTGVILRLVFEIIGGGITIDLQTVREGFEQKKMRDLFGKQRCGQNPAGEDTIIPHDRLIREILVRREHLSVGDIGHLVAHALHLSIQEIYSAHLPGQTKVTVLDRCGIHPRRQDKFVIAYHIDPAVWGEVPVEHLLPARIHTILRLVRELLTGEVDPQRFVRAYSAILFYEEYALDRAHPVKGLTRPKVARAPTGRTARRLNLARTA